MGIVRKSYEVTTVPSGLDDAVLSINPTTCFFSVETQDIRFSYDGTDPSSSEGHLQFAGTTASFTRSAHIRNLRWVSVTGTAKVTITAEGP